MQPNQPFPPDQDSNPNNQPDFEPTPTPRPPLAASPSTQPITPPEQPRPEFTRYQPQPLQPTDPAPQIQLQPQPTVESIEQEPDISVTSFNQQPSTLPQPSAPPTAVTPQPQPIIAPQSVPAFQNAPQIPQPKKSKRGLIVLSILAAILLLGGGAAAYILTRSATTTQPDITASTTATTADPDNKILNITTGTNEDYFYQAVENHMKSAYIQQDYAIILAAASTMAIDIKGTSDFTDVKTPKSYITFDMKYDNATTGELVLLGDNEKYAKLSKSGIVAMAKSETSPKLNQWYRIDGLELSSMQIYDPIRLNDMINTPSGILLVGNFDSKLRTDLMAYIKENKIYTIANSDDVTVDGRPMTHYNLTINADQVQSLNDKLHKALDATFGVTDTRFAQPADQTNEIWVDKNTGRIAKILLTTGSTGAKSTNETKISYPTSAPSTIAKPADVIPAPGQ